MDWCNGNEFVVVPYTATVRDAGVDDRRFTIADAHAPGQQVAEGLQFYVSGNAEDWAFEIVTLPLHLAA